MDSGWESEHRLVVEPFASQRFLASSFGVSGGTIWQYSLTIIDVCSKEVDIMSGLRGLQ